VDLLIHEFVNYTQARSPTHDGTSVLYISGSPGIGKTALVYSILRTLDVTVRVVSINCMALDSVNAYGTCF
jgi:cell division control protein 6